jgi:hypothetical protein
MVLLETKVERFGTSIPEKPVGFGIRESWNGLNYLLARKPGASLSLAIRKGGGVPKELL